MFEAFIQGLHVVFQWPTIGFILAGITIGAWMGAVPGLGGVTGLAILVPFTFGMDPIPALALLLAMISVTATSDSIASILLGVPGTMASQATVLDGHPLAKSGNAARAFGAAFTSSALGGVFGALLLAISIPLLLPFILSFTSAEIFMLGVLGLTMIGSLTGRSVLKGLCIGCFGVLLSSVGSGDSISIPRFVFGSEYLYDGLPVLPMVLGIFAIPELMDLALRNTSISRIQEEHHGEGIYTGIRDAWRHRWLSLRCSALGSYVGMLPGIGAAVVDWLAYGHAVHSARGPSKFGQGDIRGVIAPESANNATQGGALIPAVAFGIPGSMGTAVLLSALMLHGLQPGTEMLTTKAHITFSMVWTIVVSNVLAAGILLLWSKRIARIAFLPGHMIVPGVLVFVFMGAWMSGSSVGDWSICILFAVLGYLMKRSGWSRPPLVIGFILGDIMENRFNIAIRVHDGWSFLERPMVLLIMAIIAVTLLFSVRVILRSKKGGLRNGEGTECNTPVSLVVAAVMLAFFVLVPVESASWPRSVRQFPWTFAVPGLLFILAVIAKEFRDLHREIKLVGHVGAVWRESVRQAQLGRASKFFLQLVAMSLTMLLIGQKLALPIFVCFYLRRWGRYGWKFSLAYALAAYAILIGFYDRLLNVFWYPALLPGLFRDFLPSTFPLWLIG